MEGKSLEHRHDRKLSADVHLQVAQLHSQADGLVRAGNNATKLFGVVDARWRNKLECFKYLYPGIIIIIFVLLVTRLLLC